MFQHTFQNGSSFELFDPKTSNDKNKGLFKINHSPHTNKIFDKDLKTYVYEFNSINSRISFPGEDKNSLYLIQQFLNFQIYFPPGMAWHIQLSISDHNKTKRRIIFSSATHKFQQKTFFIKYPCPLIKEGVWTYFSVDLKSFIQAFKGQQYRSLDGIQISGHFKLRRIFTTNAPLQQFFEEVGQKPINFLPKNYYFPSNIQNQLFFLQYEQGSLIEEANQMTETSSKNTASLQNRKRQISTPNTATLPPKKKAAYQNEKNFLANTGGPKLSLRKNKKQSEIDTSQKSDFYETKVRTPMTDKNVRNKIPLAQTKGPQGRGSTQKKGKKHEEKKQIQGKLNPWRTDHKQGRKSEGRTQVMNSKIRNSEYVKTSKGMNNRTMGSKKQQDIDRRSEHYSESEYFELSQKFSTVTEGKNFKNQLNSQHISNQIEEPKIQDEIEENIEMESNSMISSHHNRNAEPTKNDFLNQKAIDESINDSLDMMKKQKKVERTMMNSYYGFGEKVMNKFMQEMERPYSPPIGDREMTDEQVSEHNIQDNEVELMYDPVLNCYYDHKTHTYYERKN